MIVTTLDPNNKTNQTLSGGNLVATSSGAGVAIVTRPITGLHYFEATITTLAGTPSVGFLCPQDATTVVLGADAFALAYRPGGTVVCNNVTLATIQIFANGDRIGVAIDPATHLVWFRVNNGNWNNNAANDPATGVGGIDYSANMKPSTLYAAIYASVTATVWTCKFSTAFTDAAPAGFASIDNIQIPRVNSSSPKEAPPAVAQTLGPSARAIMPVASRITKWVTPAGPLKSVSGVIKELGVVQAGKTIRAYRDVDGCLLGSAVSAGDGSYSIPTLDAPKVTVLAYDSPYDALAFSNVTPG